GFAAQVAATTGTSLEAESRRTMNIPFRVLALGAAIFAASTTLAKADVIAPGSTISVTGSNFQFNTGTGMVTFAANGTCATCGNYTVGGVTGTFASFFSSPNPVTFFPTAPQPGPFNLPLGVMTPHSPPGGSLEILSTT